MRVFIIVIICGLIHLPSASAASEPSKAYRDTVTIINAVNAVFEGVSEPIWLGYDLTRDAYIAYTPDDFSFLINPEAIEVPEEFAEFPDDWPVPHPHAKYLAGSYGDLSGQLRFSLFWDPFPAVAVPFNWDNFAHLTDAEAKMQFLAFLFHEPFHQYQQDNWGEITYRPERSYPIDNVENNALICLEMNLLRDALNACVEGDDEIARDLTKMFIAVRDKRWSIAGDFVCAMEQGMELKEGAAKYVEYMGVEKFLMLKDDAPEMEMRVQLRELLDQMDIGSIQELAGLEFNRQFTGASIEPGSVPRYRIYPTGAAQCMLLDYFGADWKLACEQAGPDVTFSGLLRAAIGMDDTEAGTLIDQAKALYNYGVILDETKALVDQYNQEFNENLAVFNAQDGLRVEVTLSTNGVSNGHNNSNRTWLAGEGTITLMELINLRTFNDDGLVINIRDSGLLETRVLETKLTTAAVYPGDVQSMVIDGEEAKLTAGLKLAFQSIKLGCERLDIEYAGSGNLEFNDGLLVINLNNY